MVKILLAEDQDILRNRLKQIIKNYTEHSVVEYAFDFNTLLEKVKANDYQLIILDAEMSQGDIIRVVTDILIMKPESKILLISMNAEQAFAKKFLQIGAMGYLGRDSPESEIQKAIDTVLNNKKYTSAAFLHNITMEALADKSANPISRLSEREFEIMLELFHGSSWTRISKKLKLDISTISTFQSMIFEKLGCKNMEELKAVVHQYNIASR